VSDTEFSVTEPLDAGSGWIATQTNPSPQLHAYYLADYNHVIVRFGEPAETATVALTPQAWETVIDAVGQVLNAIAVDVPGA